MTPINELEISEKRDFQVVKSNDLVLKTRYDFSLNEQKTLAYICSMIKPISVENRTNKVPFQLEYEFEILDYIRVLGLSENGRIYQEIKVLLKGLRDKSMWIKLADGTETLVGWIERVWTNQRSGTAKVRLDDRLVPYLFDLREKYLSYGLRNILLMKSAYSIRLYELLKAYYDREIGRYDKRSKLEKLHEPRLIIWKLGVDDLKKKMGADQIKSYYNFSLFKTKVLKIAQKEINDLTDLKMSFHPITKGRKTIEVEFSIILKAGDERQLSLFQSKDVLKGQVSIDDY